ncbi:MAG: hypothetical protein M3R48_04450 [Candidatus Dormibacteraeota bacterium]|nr:hypothetical protein [Candidatus Dormibacteraeota bacterium]
MGLLKVLKSMRPVPRSMGGPALPDPAVPPGNRGDWAEAALTNVQITELVKRQLRTDTRPQQK